MVMINGEARQAAGKSISQCLKEMDYDPRTVAVERNEEIVPKAQYEETILQDGDTVEVVSFVGGG
ncbi:MAG: sulfur carrier protein ThiS [Eubacterium sp.]|nr:sulfur carrier protein ThiS [Eubacterium sp.]